MELKTSNLQVFGSNSRDFKIDEDSFVAAFARMEAKESDFKHIKDEKQKNAAMNEKNKEYQKNFNTFKGRLKSFNDKLKNFENLYDNFINARYSFRTVAGKQGLRLTQVSEFEKEGGVIAQTWKDAISSVDKLCKIIDDVEKLIPQNSGAQGSQKQVYLSQEGHKVLEIHE